MSRLRPRAPRLRCEAVKSLLSFDSLLPGVGVLGLTPRGRLEFEREPS